MRIGDTVYITFTSYREDIADLHRDWTCPLCHAICKETCIGHVRVQFLKLSCSSCRCSMEMLGQAWSYVRDTKEARELSLVEQQHRSITIPKWKVQNLDVRYYGYRVTSIPPMINSRVALLLDFEHQSLENFDEPTEAEIQAALDTIWTNEVIVNLGNVEPPTDQSMIDEVRRLGCGRRTRGN